MELVCVEFSARTHLHEKCGKAQHVMCRTGATCKPTLVGSDDLPAQAHVLTASPHTQVTVAATIYAGSAKKGRLRMVVCSQHRQNHARGWQNNSVCTSTASTATRGTFVNVCTSEHQPSADLMGSEAGGGSTATVDPTQQSRCPINAAE